MPKYFQYPLVFLTGGFIYSIIEVIFRGYTHWTMTVLGGIIFIILFKHFDNHPDESFIRRCFFGGILITVLEFVTGCIVNLWLGWDVWDYSNQYPNLLGQVCLFFAMVWFFATIPAYYICRFLKFLFTHNAPLHV